MTSRTLLLLTALFSACTGKPTEPPITCKASCTRPDGTFANPPGSPHSTASRWEFQKFVFGSLLGPTNPAVPIGHVLPPSQAEAAWQAQPGDKLQWLGHSAFRLHISGTTLLTDPFLTRRASPFRWAGPTRYVPSPLQPENARADLILITHNHYDHLDLATLKRLPNKTTVRVIVPLGVAPLVRQAGITHVTELDWHQSLTVNGLTITLVPAIHFSARWTHDRNRTLWGGYVIRSTNPQNPLNIWQSGDTTTHPTVFTEIGQRYGPFSHGLVSIGAYEPRSIMVGSHTTPEDAAQQGTQTQSKRLIAHHWGTIVLTPEPHFEAPQRFHTAATRQGYSPENTWLLKVGETRPLRR